MQIQNRYFSAVHSSNLKSSPDTTASDPDVLGAYGIADRRLCAGVDADGNRVHDPRRLAVPLARLFAGDKGAAQEIVGMLAPVIRHKANALRLRLTPIQCMDMARIVLGWFRNSACQSCGGHGFKIIPGTKTLGDSRCHPCDGTGKVPLELGFRLEQRELVRWAVAQIEREVGVAGPAALRALKPSLEF